jgi:hypothetical protein
METNASTVAEPTARAILQLIVAGAVVRAESSACMRGGQITQCTHTSARQLCHASGRREEQVPSPGSSAFHHEGAW